MNADDTAPAPLASRRRDRQIAAGWLLGLVILASPSLAVVPPRISEIPLAVSGAYVIVLALAVAAGVGLVAGIRGRPAAWAAPLAGLVVVAAILLATLAGVLTD